MEHEEDKKEKMREKINALPSILLVYTMVLVADCHSLLNKNMYFSGIMSTRKKYGFLKEPPRVSPLNPKDFSHFRKTRY